MIRTHIIPCDLPRPVCDFLNMESGRIYTQVCIYHWRTYRKKGVWLSQYKAMEVNDFFRRGLHCLHAHTVDAAQEGFYKACKTTRKARKAGVEDIKFPYRRKRFRTTIWKNTAIKNKDGILSLSNGNGNRQIIIKLPENLRDVLRILEVRLVYEKKAKKYFWHIVVENGKQPEVPKGDNIVSVDLGEVHPAVVGDEQEAVIITCRELRHEKQGHNKRLAKLNEAISRTRKGSRKRARLVRTRTRLRAKHKRIVRDMEHKISKSIVEVGKERKADTIVIGNVGDVSNGVAMSKRANQKISQWSHGKIRQYVGYKAEAEGIKVVSDIDERYTTQTCPNCGKRHKPKGRIYRCPACKFQSHRDVVGQVNILSVYKYGEPGKIPAPSIIKHRIPHNLRVMRRRRDTGQGTLSQRVPLVACRCLQEAASLQ